MNYEIGDYVTIIWKGFIPEQILKEFDQNAPYKILDVSPALDSILLEGKTKKVYFRTHDVEPYMTDEELISEWDKVINSPPPVTQKQCNHMWIKTPKLISGFYIDCKLCGIKQEDVYHTSI